MQNKWKQQEKHHSASVMTME